MVPPGERRIAIRVMARLLNRKFEPNGGVRLALMFGRLKAKIRRTNSIGAGAFGFEGQIKIQYERLP